MATEVIMPVLGEGVIEGQIARWLKKEGDKIKRFEPILEIETDKVTTEATAEVEGVLLKILVAQGETVPVGTVLAYIGTAGETMGDAAAPQAKQPALVQMAPTPGGKGINGHPGSGSRPLATWASPVVKRMAARGLGAIVNVIGAGGKVASPTHLSGGAANAALMLVTAGLAATYGSSGVRVNAVTPGFFPAEQNRRLLFYHCIHIEYNK